jgi:hypothetical protein
MRLASAGSDAKLAPLGFTWGTYARAPQHQTRTSASAFVVGPSVGDLLDRAASHNLLMLITKQHGEGEEAKI